MNGIHNCHCRKYRGLWKLCGGHMRNITTIPRSLPSLVRNWSLFLTLLRVSILLIAAFHDYKNSSDRFKRLEPMTIY
jgi:hypothetical protein